MTRVEFLQPHSHPSLGRVADHLAEVEADASTTRKRVGRTIHRGDGVCIGANDLHHPLKPMTAIPTTATVAAAGATCQLPRKTYKQQGAMTSPGWVFGIVGLVSPLVGLTIYGLKQKSWSYLYVGLALFVGFFTASDVEGEIDPGAKVALSLTAGGAAALVARNNKKNARKELGFDD